MASKRRPKGEGSIYQDKNKVWWAQLEIEGKLVRRRSATRPLASQKLKELIRDRDDKIRIHSAEQSLEEFLNHWRIQVLERKNFAPNTMTYYGDMVQGHILPYLGTYKLSELDFDVIQPWIDKLSKSMAWRAYSILNSAMKWAVHRKFLRDNPCDHVIIPGHTTRDQRALTIDEIKRLRSVAPIEWLLFYEILYTLGLRLGESLGLQWSDIDWIQGTIRIERQVQEIRKTGSTHLESDAEPKRNSVRTIALPHRLIQSLQQAYTATEQRYQKDGITWSGHGPIFPSKTGGFRWPHNVSRQFRVHRDRANIPGDIHLHSFRHTCTSWLDEVGATETVKAAILGHAKKTVTQRYSHASIQAMRIVLEKVEQEKLAQLAA
jgi:integrase